MKVKILFFLILVFSLTISTTVFCDIPGNYDLIVPNIPPKAHSLNQVTLTEVFAFDCGHCYNFAKNQIPELTKKFGNKIKLIQKPIGWRGHDPGRLFFIAEEKGKGHEVMMMIFNFIFDKGVGRSMFQRNRLKFIARRAGLYKEFQTRMDDPAIVKKMNDSIQYAEEREIHGTPTLIIEDKMIARNDLPNLITIINALLKEPVE
jgi:predicted DsbA family dithiol-disulfide isomerase